MAVRHKSKVHSRRLSLWLVGCTPALSVTYNAAAAAVRALWRYVSVCYLCVWARTGARLRVRDINDAIRELGQMVAVHTGASSSTFTKLTVLQEAVRVITDLENRLRGTDGRPAAR